MPIQTVTEINQSIKLLLENGFSYISVRGEVSNLRKPFSGHLYFSLKDSASQLKAVLFKMQHRYLSLPLEDGLEVICHGRISVYEPRGEYQIIVDSIDFQGDGALQIAFEKLKQKLSSEGLFDKLHKRPLPFLPAKIAVVTSPHGAAIQDFLKGAGARCPSIPIDIYPVSVQGDSAAGEIIASLQLINNNSSADVIVLCRGGGSMEDLWTFNDESLARAVFDSHIPIISAIGHEIDFTIVDFVADSRAATPTAAVEAVMPDSMILREKIANCSSRIIQAFKNKISFMRDRINSLKRITGTPVDRINHGRMRIDYLLVRSANALKTMIQQKKYNLLKAEDQFALLNPEIRLKTHRDTVTMVRHCLQSAMAHILKEKSRQLTNLNGVLIVMSPLAVLDRGYAIVQSSDDKTIIKSKSQVSEGEILNILLAEGRLCTQVLPDSNKKG